MKTVRLSPFINSEFVCLEAAIFGLLQRLMEGNEDTFTVSLADAEIPVLTFYVQAENFAKTGQIVIEAERNIATEQIILQRQDLKARVYGWTVPAEGDKNPNYRQTWDLKKTTSRRVAQELIEAIKFLGRVKEDAWFTISPESLSNEVLDSGLMWAQKGNPTVMCQAGQNVKTTIEGRARAGLAA